MNRAWHERHPMPPRPTLGQRKRWHREHAQYCGCRPIPPGLGIVVRKALKGKKKIQPALLFKGAAVEKG